MMRRVFLAISCCFALLASSTGNADAAERTDVLMFGKVDVGVRYNGTFVLGQHTEGKAVQVARYSHIVQEIGFTGEVGIVPGLEFGLLIPYRAYDRYKFSEAQFLGFDPESGLASFNGGEVPSDGLRQTDRSGFGDIWLNFTGSPFNEQFDPPSFGTLAFQFGLKIPSAPKMLKVQNSGNMGFGTGAVDVRLGGGFSKRWKSVDPYIWAEWTSGTKFKADLTDSTGNVVTADAELNPSETFTISVGTEAIAMENKAIGTKFAADIRLSGSYVSPATWFSGYRLHEIAPATEGLLAHEDEFVRVQALLGLYVTVQKHFKLQVGTSLDWETPHILEAVDRGNYRLRTGPETFIIGAFFQAEGHF